MMKTLFLVALMAGMTVSASAQTSAPPAAPAEASGDPAAEAAWAKISDDSQHIQGYLQTGNKPGLVLLTPPTLKELSAFDTKYPHDERAAKGRLLAAQLSNLERKLEMPDAPSAKEVGNQFDAISADTSLPRMERVQAALLAVNAMMEAVQGKDDPAAYDAIEQRIEAFQKQFGDVPLSGKVTGTSILRQEQIGLLKSSGDKALYDALLAKLAADPDPEIVAVAKKEQAGEAAEAGLKSKPVDLAFTALDGSKVNLAKLRGKVVLIDFWATWCGPCRAEVPDVVATYEKYHGKGFDIVGISLDQDKAALQKYIADNHMTWPQYFDGKGWDNAISSRFGIGEVPAIWLVGKDGKLATTDGRDDLAGQVAKLLAAP
jgi:thiol-disulfide isomerase/thioredoxin